MAMNKLNDIKHSRLIFVIFIFSLISFLTGCYPDKIDYVDEYDIAVTRYEEEADFSSYNTFSVLDTIIHLT